MSSSPHIDNKKKDILIFGRGPTQVLEHTLTAEKMYSINLQWQRSCFAYVCTIMEQIVIYLLMVLKFINLKQKLWNCGK